VRALLSLAGWTINIHLGRDQPDEPQRQGDVYAVTERADSWDHDQREPIGFRRPR
jgi:hypothetical protein